MNQKFSAYGEFAIPSFEYTACAENDYTQLRDKDNIHISVIIARCIDTYPYQLILNWKWLVHWIIIVSVFILVI